LAVLNDQIQPPIKTQKEEKLAILKHMHLLLT
jgi:hypothetical protein